MHRAHAALLGPKRGNLGFLARDHDAEELALAAALAFRQTGLVWGIAFLVLIIAIVVFALVGRPALWLMVLSRVLLIPVIAALGYEVTYFGARHVKNALVRLVLAPGLLLQRLTTGEPDDTQMEVAVAALKKAAEQGILIYTIGIGDPKGAPIPMTSEDGNANFRKDSDGNIIISKLNETMLQDVAVATGGVYSRANNVSFGLNKVLDDMKNLNKAEVKTKVYSAYNDQFQYILGFALFFLLFEFVILERKNRYLKNINLFK